MVNYNPVKKTDIYMYKNCANTLLDIEHTEMLRRVRRYLMKVHIRLLGRVVI